MIMLLHVMTYIFIKRKSVSVAIHINLMNNIILEYPISCIVTQYCTFFFYFPPFFQVNSLKKYLTINYMKSVCHISGMQARYSICRHTAIVTLYQCQQLVFNERVLGEGGGGWGEGGGGGEGGGLCQPTLFPHNVSTVCIIGESLSEKWRPPCLGLNVACFSKYRAKSCDNGNYINGTTWLLTIGILDKDPF